MVRTRSDDAEADPCPICLDDPKFAAETNCGHMFCSDCILQIRRNAPLADPITCPSCRQDVTVLLECFTNSEAEVEEQEQLEVKNRIVREIKDYNRIYSRHPRSILGQLRDLPTILRHVWAELFTWRGLSYIAKLRFFLCFFACLFYTILPFDLLPEAILGLIGFLDDIVIVVFLLIQVGTFYRNEMGN